MVTLSLDVEMFDEAEHRVYSALVEAAENLLETLPCSVKITDETGTLWDGAHA